MFYGFVITNDGNNLLNNMVAGEKLTITKVVMEKGTAESAEAARQLTAPIDPGPDGTSTKPTVEGNAVSLIVEYRSDLNGGLNEGFWIGGFAVYGKTDTSAEIMMYYGSLGDKKQYVSAYVSGTAPDVRRYPVSITVKDGIKVDVSYPAEAWMTAEDVADYFNGTLKPDLEGSLKEILEQHDEDQTAHENRFQGKQDNLNTLQAKDNLVDADMVAITDSANNETAKRISWANIKALLNRIFVPLTRTVNNKGLTSDVTLTGADINVSGTDATSISTALSNKAGGADHKIKTYTDYGDIGLSGTEITVAQIFAALPIGSALYTNNSPTSCLGADFRPSTVIYGLLLARKITDSSMLLEWHSPLNYDGTVAGDYTSAYRSLSTTPWSGWAPEATATAPQEYDLPLASNVTKMYSCRYSRDQFGRVVCYGTMTPTREITSGITIATLPAGYRPTNALRVAGIVVDQSGFASVIGIGIATTGEVSVRGDTVPSTAQYVSFLVAFQGA